MKLARTTARTTLTLLTDVFETPLCFVVVVGAAVVEAVEVLVGAAVEVAVVVVVGAAVVEAVVGAAVVIVVVGDTAVVESALRKMRLIIS